MPTRGVGSSRFGVGVRAPARTSSRCESSPRCSTHCVGSTTAASSALHATTSCSERRRHAFENVGRPGHHLRRRFRRRRAPCASRYDGRPDSHRSCTYSIGPGALAALVRDDAADPGAGFRRSRRGRRSHRRAASRRRHDGGADHVARDQLLAAVAGSRPARADGNGNPRPADEGKPGRGPDARSDSRAAPLAPPRQSSGCSRNHAIVRLRPSSNGTTGSQPSASRASVMSG